MTSEEIQASFNTFSRLMDSHGAKDPDIPLWEIAYQLAKQVELGTETNQLLRIQISRMPKPDTLADPQPAKRYADSERGRCIECGHVHRSEYCCGTDASRDIPASLLSCGLTHTYTCHCSAKNFQRPRPADPATEATDQIPPINPSENPHRFDGALDHPYCFRCGGGRLHVIHTVKESYSLAGSGDTTKDAAGSRCICRIGELPLVTCPVHSADWKPRES